MRKFILLFTLLFFAATFSLKAQSCFNIYAAGGDIYTSCLNTCPDITFHVPDIRTSEDYKVISIPYEPYPFIVPGGTESPLVYDDDHFSDSFDLAFPFCFYGNTYSKICVGSNGVITFDIKTNAKTIEGYQMHRGDHIPYAGGTSNTQETYYAPRASIFLAYYDMNPITSPPEMKIQYRVEGSAPCRKFVVSYYHVDYYDDGSGCSNKLCTMQAVLYEGSGIIDVFYENKPTCPAYLFGLSIAGVQNWEQSRAVPLPGKNGTVWTAVNEGYRYVPNGPTSLLSHVELYKNNALIPITPTITDPGTGELDVTFPGVCQPEDSMSYVVKAFYKQCHDPSIEAEGSDTIIVKKTLDPLSIATTDALCPGASNGKISITDPVAPNIEYSIDGGITWQTSNVFTKPAGTYDIIARVIGSTCTGKTTATVADPPPLAITTAVIPVTCFGLATGVIQITDHPGDPDYEYSKDAGISWQPSNTFAVPAGHYTIIVRKISANCTNSVTVDVTEPALLAASALQQTPASCLNHDGILSISATGGTIPYQYSIDNGATYQASNIFSSLDTGSYKLIKVKDLNGCMANVTPVKVALADNMTLSFGSDTTICVGQSVTLAPLTNTETNIFIWTQSPNNNTLSATDIKNPIATPTSSTKYTLNVTLGLCKRTAGYNITVLNKPVANAGLDTTICAKDPAFLHGSATNLSGPAYYAWNADPKLTYTSIDSARATVKPDTLTQYIFNVKDNYGCNFSVYDSMVVFINPKIIPFAGNDTIGMYGKPFQLNATGGSRYVWRPADHLDNPFIPDPKANLTVDTYFSVLVYDNIGCVASDDIFVKVYQGPNYYVPNAFTPNGDGLNDIFRPIPSGIKTTNYFRVFDRSGQLMYETNRFLQGWDGTYKGKKMQQGVYVWIISGVDEKGNKIEDKGTVLLLR